MTPRSNHIARRRPPRLSAPALLVLLAALFSCSEDLPIEPEESGFSEAGIKLSAEAVAFGPTIIGRTDTFRLSVEYGDTIDMVLLLWPGDSAHFTAAPDSFVFGRRNQSLDVILTYTPTTVDEPDLSQLFLTTYLPEDSAAGLALDTVGTDSLRMSGVGRGEFLDLELVFVPGGTFTMGIDSSEAFADPNKLDQWGVHQVSLSDFFIGRYEVTNLQYYEFWTEVRPEHTPNDSSITGEWPHVALQKPNFPVVGVSWEDAAAYCRWLSLRTGERIDLPTEAQWQYTASGGAGRTYPWSQAEGEEPDPADTLDPGPLANVRLGGDGYTYTAPVDAFSAGASEFGPLNMSGNVWEWCRDWYAPDYYRTGGPAADTVGGGSPTPWIDPQGPDDPEHRQFKVVRGGSWNEEISQATTANRSAVSPENRELHVGFRVVRLP